MGEIETISEKGENKFLIPGAIIMAGFLIAGAILYSNSSGKDQRLSSGTAAVNQPVVSPTPGNLADNDPFLGNPDAPVTVVEFSDFQCPFCQRFHGETLPRIIDEYVKTGKVKFVYRDFPLSAIHGMAQKAAEAGECANEQGKFWEYHDLLFLRQDQLGVMNFIQWAGELGLDSDRFANCLESGKYSAEVEGDYRDGEAAGVKGTPANFINGRILEGALPFSKFQAIIEEELKKVE